MKNLQHHRTDGSFATLSRLSINPLSAKWTSRSRSSRSAGGTVWRCRRRSLCFWLRTSTAGWTSPTQRWSFRPRSEPDRETDSNPFGAGAVAPGCKRPLNVPFWARNRVLIRDFFSASSHKTAKCSVVENCKCGFGVFQEEGKISRMNVESRVRKDRESL